MLSFSPVDEKSAIALAPYFCAQPYRACDNTVGAVFQWRSYFASTYTITNGLAVLHARYPGEGLFYMFPVGGGDLEAAFAAVEADARERKIPLRYCAVPEAGVQALVAHYGDRAQYGEPHRAWADYLYEIESLKTFSGKKLHGQKNHLNRFWREYPSARYVEVTAETLSAAEHFLAGYDKHTPQDKPIEQEEMRRARELLHEALPLGQRAGYIEVDGTVIALAVGEVTGDTLYVHVEKARLDYPGAYQAIVSQFAIHASCEDTKYENREDDSGEEGLRTSKLAYQPIALIEKYWVTITEA